MSSRSCFCDDLRFHNIIFTDIAHCNLAKESMQPLIFKPDTVQVAAWLRGVPLHMHIRGASTPPPQLSYPPP